MSNTKSNQTTRTFLWPFSQTFGLAYSPLNSATLSCSSEVTLIYMGSPLIARIRTWKNCYLKFMQVETTYCSNFLVNFYFFIFKKVSSKLNLDIQSCIKCGYGILLFGLFGNQGRFRSNLAQVLQNLPDEIFTFERLKRSHLHTKKNLSL